MQAQPILKNLQPSQVFAYFEEICQIPHGSYHIDEISDYLVSFAKKQGLSYVQDEEKNVVIYCPATPGYEAEETIILQAHMDMVAVAEAGTAIDMEKDALRLVVEDDVVYAKGTSLGADDGIGVAMIMAILSDDTLEHPALEALITTNEEVGMEGARGLSANLLHGHRLINVDSEEEGILTVGCAGGQRVEAFLQGALEDNTGVTLDLEISGLLGGHSGTMIHTGRANANVLAGCFVELLAKFCDARFVSLSGGEKCNAICSETLLKMAIPEAMLTKASNTVKHIFHQMCAHYKDIDPGLSLRGEVSKENAPLCFDKVSTERVARLIQDMPDGVVAMMEGQEDLVETSLNLGVARMETEDTLHTFYELRSNKADALASLSEKVETIARDRGCEVVKDAGYPGWEFQPDSPLRDKMVKCFLEQYGVLPKVDVVHAGLECGLLSTKIKNLDAVSLGPDMENIHTAAEKLHVSSVERVYKYLRSVLSTKDN
ncbi:MAG: beta-Ala-His dipeptidase [Lachnospiraceae bacterium]|nr:beta-Ala-His dipeptidase [Lachnospiraceae bacterium]